MMSDPLLNSGDIDELLGRLSNHFDKLNDRSCEYFLVKELYQSTAFLKDFINESIGDSLDEIEKSIEALEKDVINLTNEVSNIEKDSASINRDLGNLTVINKQMAERIKAIIEEDELINTTIDSAETEFSELQIDLTESATNVDREIRNTNQNVVGKIDETQDMVDKIDIPSIQDDIKDLYNTDDLIKKEIETNHTNLNNRIDELEPVDDTDIVEDLTNLANKDTELRNSIVAISESSATSVTTLENQNNAFTEDINNHKQTVTALEKDSQRGSIEAREDKIPVANDTGVLANEWRKVEPP